MDQFLNVFKMIVRWRNGIAFSVVVLNMLKSAVYQSDKCGSLCVIYSDSHMIRGGEVSGFKVNKVSLVAHIYEVQLVSLP